jgi:hypothetical protein
MLSLGAASMWKDGRTDGRTDITKLTVANAPKNQQVCCNVLTFSSSKQNGEC